MRVKITNKIKFILNLSVSVCLCVLLSSSVAIASEYYSEGFFQYTENSDSVTIHSYFGKEEEVVIPDKIADKPVTAIDDYAFWNGQTVTTITIPDTVITIGKDAFTGAVNLTKIKKQSEQAEVIVDKKVEIVEDYPEYAPEDIIESESNDITENKKNQNENSDEKSNANMEMNHNNGLQIDGEVISEDSKETESNGIQADSSKEKKINATKESLPGDKKTELKNTNGLGKLKGISVGVTAVILVLLFVIYKKRKRF